MSTTKKTFKKNTADNPVMQFLSKDKLENSIRTVNTDTIKTEEPFKSLFPIREEVLNAIVENIKEHGFDPSQPLIIWQEKDVLLDGHTRLEAAKQAEIDTVPVVMASFKDEDEAMSYMYRLQFSRRNIKDSELIRVSRNALEKYEQIFGDGGKAEYLARKLSGLSRAKAKQLIVVLDKASADQIMEIVNETSTMYNIYKKIKDYKESSDDNFASTSKVDNEKNPQSIKAKTQQKQSSDDDTLPDGERTEEPASDRVITQTSTETENDLELKSEVLIKTDKGYIPKGEKTRIAFIVKDGGIFHEQTDEMVLQVAPDYRNEDFMQELQQIVAKCLINNKIGG